MFDCCSVDSPDPPSRPSCTGMSIERVVVGQAACLEEGLALLGIEVAEATAAHQHLLQTEPSWRDGTRVARSGRVTPGNLPLVFNNLLKHCTTDVDTHLAMMSDNLQNNSDWDIQIYEIFFTERELVEKKEKNNMMAAAKLRKKSNTSSCFSIHDINVDSLMLQYNLVIFFQYRYITMYHVPPY